MRTLSSVASITIHVGLGAAVLLGTAKTGRSDPTPPIEHPIVFQPASPVEKGGGVSLPDPITVVQPDIGNISITTPLPQTGPLMPSFSPVYAGAVSTPSTGLPGGMGTLFTDEHAEVLSGPLPRFRWSRRPIPGLLRRRGRRCWPPCFGQPWSAERRSGCGYESRTNSPSGTAPDVLDKRPAVGSSGCHRFVIFALLAGMLRRVLLLSEPVHQPGGDGGV
jgi:hypothetical protein